MQILINDRDKLVKEKVRLQNQLRSTLRGYYRQALGAFSDLTCPTALDFLLQFPDSQRLEKQTQTDWIQFLDQHRLFNPKARQRFLAAVSGADFLVDRAVVSAKSLLTQGIGTQLQSLMATLGVYEKRIQRLVESFDDSDLFKSLPGVDLILTAKLLVGIGTNGDRFSDAHDEIHRTNAS